MSNTDGAGAIAFKGLGMMFSASKQGMAALSGGLSKVRKQYAAKHEADMLTELKKKGLHPSDFLFQALQKLDYLSLAGYKQELTIVSQQVARRLLDSEKSTVPLEVVLVLGGSMSDEALRFGDFQKSSILKGLQEYLNMSRVGKEHFDRDTLVHEFYYAVLLCSEETGANWQQLETVCKEAVRRVVTMGGAEDSNHEMQHKSAKAMFTFASAVRLAAQQEEQKRNKSLRDAEALIQREQEKRARMLASLSSNTLSPAASLKPTSTISSEGTTNH